MAGSTFGTLFTITTWGESHGPALGVVVDGCPAGIPLTSDYIQTFLDRRKPGQSKFTTARKESDSVEILSGVFEGYTTGTPISLIVRNTDQRSHDYSKIKDCYRPGHADYTFDQKYGVRDYRGGGRTSGRETIGRVAGGAIACRILEALGIHLTTYTKAIGPFSIPSDAYDYSAINENRLYMPNQKYAEQASAYLESCIREQDSSGGLIECMIHGMPSGIGEPVFENRNIKQKMAYIPDELFYFMQADTMEMKRFYEGIYPQFDSKLFYKMQEFFPTIDVKRTIRRLSKGMQKQVAFWLAICCKPDLLILDEPVDGLDPVMRRQIWSILMAEVAERKMTVLVSSHNLRELEDTCEPCGHHAPWKNYDRAVFERSSGKYFQDTGGMSEWCAKIAG